MSGRRRPLLTFGLGLALLVAVDQALQWTVLADGYVLRRRIAPFDPPIFHEGQAEKLASIRQIVQAPAKGLPDLRGTFGFDAELGWCPLPGSGLGEEAIDWAGARIGDGPFPRSPTPGVRRIVAVGDSFTYGSEVGARESWIAVLDRERDDLEIANLGVGGYGTDQAILRWRRDGEPLRPDEVWVGVVPSRVLRDVSVYVPAMMHWTTVVAFKPRARVQGDGSVAMTRCPVRSLEELVACFDSQERFLSAVGGLDRWVSAWPAAYAPRGSHWSHASGLARIALTILEHGGRDPHRELSDPDGEEVAILRGLLGSAASELAADGRRLRLIVLPDRSDLADLRERGETYWSAAVRVLEEAGVEVIDFAPELLEAGTDLDDASWMPGDHYAATTNRLVAELVARRIR